MTKPKDTGAGAYFMSTLLEDIAMPYAQGYWIYNLITQATEQN